ncbi:MAG: tetratricopeptide repeat protein, partial [Alphaproteobacteria bacterium]|nr:tetratricopeptide repeat protein [Alphaproteobacteria bacterium]
MSASRHLRRKAAEHFAAERLKEAAAAYAELLALVPEDFEALHRLGTIRIQLGDSAEGHRLLTTATRVDAGTAETWLHLGMAAQNLGRLEEAVTHYRQALTLQPDYAAALFRLGVLLRALGRRPESLQVLDHCVALAPREETVLQLRGEIKFELEDWGGAMTDFSAILERKPDSVPALIYGGVTRGQQQQYVAEGLALLDRAAVLAPGRAEIHFNRGVLLELLERDDEALAAYDRAVAINPRHADAWNNRGGILRRHSRLEEAIDNFSRALGHAPRHLAALINRGVALGLLNRDREAAADFNRVLAIEPDNSAAMGGMALAALAACDWQSLERLTPRLASPAVYGQGGVSPFTMLQLFDDPKLLHDCTVPFLKRLVPQRTARRPPLPPAGGRIRIAYVSSDYHTHATAHLIADLIERHDRSRFEINGFSYGVDDGKAERARLKRGFDRFIEVQALSDSAAAELMRQLDTDIAVDLKGYTLWARPGIFAHGPAPVTVSWLGYPGSMAVNWYDYVLADKMVLPHAQQPFYDENIVHLPDCYQPNDPSRPLVPVTRAAAGLPNSGFVFCSFNIHRKITRPIFECWMRLLSALPGSLLWLLDDTANAVLSAKAAARGIDPSRVIFAPKVDLAAHLGRCTAADLMLDTMPYGAHTTASDALWAGVPMVTLLGPSFANRVAASLLTAMGTPELITTSLQDYESLALALARDLQRLAALKA